MTNEELDKLHKNLYNIEKDILCTKGKEYLSNEDKLSFFTDYASRLGISAEKVVGIFLLKHFNSIMSYIKNGKVESNESIQSRIVDARNYLLFLQALIEDKSKNERRK